jgi:lipopolysaccharide biosynthesis regulator YciM
VIGEYLLLLAILVSLLIGFVIGKTGERYRLQQGQLVDRRKVRGSPHYLHGLNFLISGQLDPAIEEFQRAATLNVDGIEVPLILGNLYREKGQVGRAIQTHQQILQRPRLTRLEHGYVQLCLGFDYRRGGFVDRALEAFHEVLRLDPSNRDALLNLEKLHADQHQWQEAYDIRQRLVSVAPPDQQARHRAILAFLETELGREAMKRGDSREAARQFAAAIERDPRVVPAYLNLGDVRLQEEDVAGAVEVWERVLQVAPDRGYLIFDRLASAYARLGCEDRFAALCRRLTAESPQDWRARLALARYLSARGAAREAFELLLEALAVNPHPVTLHQSTWQVLSQLRLDPAAVDRYVIASREAVFFQDPHVCLRCRYRSNELLWQCPHCHEWNTFVEERLTPSRDDAELLGEPTA